MIEPIFADTNVLIRLLNGDSLATELLDGKQVYISVVTEMEMQCQPQLTRPERNIINELLADCVSIDLSQSIKQRAIQIRLTTRLKLMDAIVAATATDLGFTLLTADEKFRSHKQTPVVILPPVF
ncbi:type II toxin-antitoxin system VapC family toxin [Fibrella sp. HMF5335]|uniref:Type II toxin-antitoxin system VapC family toxin n=1 Tax=Fibrella rubiginis TaxID=2817060 RepID=A0A939GE51_9BACT|nr:type II toxin-antitoxin system VapC family toxin [Fibrella rubiginis]MBO0936118.1 type II toxin-antitoxin system VapC family toxin [Fibrella rubiginis]